MMAPSAGPSPVASSPSSADGPAVGRVVLRALGVTKHYGATLALQGVDFQARAGQVTALFGENGAGKSTLMKIMSGVEHPTSGVLELDGEPVSFHSTAEAEAHGVAIIHQELSLCYNLNVRDNIFLGREVRGRGGRIDFAAEERVVSDVLARLEEDIDPRRDVASLRLGQQQVVEIARALAGEARVLIMDEPTSALSSAEVAVLFRVTQELKAHGVAVIYISHHLEEAIELADLAVVLRDGNLVASHPKEGLKLSWVVAAMLGRAGITEQRAELVSSDDAVLLEVRDVNVPEPHGAGRLAVDGVSLDVRAGEVVCLFGLMGAGRTELLECLAGRVPMASGSIVVDGRDVTKASVRERIASGLGLVPEDRQRDGLVQLLSVGANLSLAGLATVYTAPFVDRSAEQARVARAIDDVKVKTAGPNASITSLSGGNQQKVVIGKMLLVDPKVLLLDEPTRGVDVGAKAEIFRLLLGQAERGLAVLFATSEIGEALAHATRVVVLRKGKVVRQFDAATADRDTVIAAAGGASHDLLEQALA